MNTDFGLDWLDYGARWYDPAIGIFGQIDPRAEDYYSYTPYNYTGGNPIKRIDINGEGWGLAIKAIKAARKVWELYRKKQKLGKRITKKDIENLGIDEITDVIDDVSELLDGDLTLDDVLAVSDLAFGTELVSKRNKAASKAKDKASDATNKAKKKKDSSKNEKHGDGGRELSKSEQQIENLQGQMQGATKKEKKKLQNKINNIRQNAAKKKKGEEHSRTKKQ